MIVELRCARSFVNHRNLLVILDKVRREDRSKMRLCLQIFERLLIEQRRAGRVADAFRYRRNRVGGLTFEACSVNTGLDLHTLNFVGDLGQRVVADELRVVHRVRRHAHLLHGVAHILHSAKHLRADLLAGLGILERDVHAVGLDLPRRRLAVGHRAVRCLKLMHHTLRCFDDARVRGRDIAGEVLVVLQ